MALIHLIYVSTARTELEVAELDRILASSVRHNNAAGITGMLLYAGGSFLQVLEGEEGAVDETYARVEKDPRHKDVILLERAPIAARSFAQWGMGFRRLGAADESAHPAYVPFFRQGFDAARIGARPGLALEILTEFAASQRA